MSVKVLWYANDEPRRQYPSLVPPSEEVASYARSPIEPDRTRRARTQRTIDPASPVTPRDAIARAEKALATAVGAMSLDDPMLPALLDSDTTPTALREYLAQLLVGGWKYRRVRQGDGDADPWPLGGGAEPNSTVYDSADGRGAHWRSLEEPLLDADPFAYVRRLIAPITVPLNVAFLVRCQEASSPATAQTAREFLTEIQPSIEASLADSIRADDPWRDTFLLWLLVREPFALEVVHPLVVALATRYGTLASQFAGIVYGSSGAFIRQPLVSATAHLGIALWKLDYRPSLLPGIVAFVRQSQRPDGGFGDPGQPSDVLTTLAAAHLLSALDRDWEPEPTARWFAGMQEPEGWWRALDPEVPWLTRAILEWLRSAERPFAERFAWPEYQKLDRDRKTGVLAYAAFDRLVRVFSEVPGLGRSVVQIAFLDLAHFRAFNNRFGQRRGDDVLRAFAQALAAIPGVIVIRDGGDEFMVVGPPTASDLDERLDAFMASWPGQLRARFGADTPPVAPRIIVSATATGCELESKRELLGRLITPVKTHFGDPGAEGIKIDEERALELDEPDPDENVPAVA